MKKPKLESVPGDLPEPPYDKKTVANSFGLDFDVHEFKESDVWAICPPEVRPWIAYAFLMSWVQHPCGSLPSDQEILAVRLGCSQDFLRLHRDRIMDGWYLCSDHRYYHPRMIEKVEAMISTRKAWVKKKKGRNQQNQQDKSNVYRGIQGESKESPRGVQGESKGSLGGVSGESRGSLGGVSGRSRGRPVGARAESPETSGESPAEVADDGGEPGSRNQQNQQDKSNVYRGLQGESQGSPLGVPLESPSSLSLSLPSSEELASKQHLAPATLKPDDDGRASSDCPFEEIRLLWMEKCPHLPAPPPVSEWTAVAKDLVKARWSDELPSLDHWRRTFGYVDDSDFLSGRKKSSSGKIFRASLFWIVKQEPLTRLYNGDYDG